MMRVVRKGDKDIVYCNVCKKYLIADKEEVWYKEHTTT
ncbi:MAG: hypothetical protein KatS3mg003_1498 [Candidatus Nitrosocaldaceae archaeon]|nr:MAG: hypothetical protein KatS3mg003_1498 [Candidatus Nitrosocaldaceae archaeon]